MQFARKALLTSEYHQKKRKAKWFTREDQKDETQAQDEEAKQSDIEIQIEIEDGHEDSETKKKKKKKPNQESLLKVERKFWGSLDRYGGGKSNLD